MLRAGGPVPRHVAIVMDGNRRFAASRNMRRERGHEFGAEKLLEVLEWCLALGVRCLSVYAFSTDNFKRSEAEIATLMDLAERRLDELADSDAIRARRVRVQVLGELHTLPPGVRRAAARATSATWHHDGPVLNVCFAYTGREDIAQAVATAGEGVRRGVVAAADVDERLLERCLHGGAFGAMARPTKTTETTTSDDAAVDEIARGDEERRRASSPATSSFFPRGGVDPLWDTDDSVGGESPRTSSPSRARGEEPSTIDDGNAPVDLLIRTSGETRLSDFILWGVSQHAVLLFMEVLWPDFSFTDMCHAVWAYQRSARHAMGARRRFRAARARRADDAREAARRRDGAGKRGAGEWGGTSVAWVNLGGARGDAAAFVAELNRGKVRATLHAAERSEVVGGSSEAT